MSLALLLPSFVGVSRAFVSGMPLSWYGSVVEASLIYIPAALAGVLMPIKATTKREADASMQSMGLGTLRLLLEMHMPDDGGDCVVIAW